MNTNQNTKTWQTRLNLLSRKTVPINRGPDKGIFLECLYTRPSGFPSNEAHNE